MLLAWVWRYFTGFPYDIGSCMESFLEGGQRGIFSDIASKSEGNILRHALMGLTSG